MDKPTNQPTSRCVGHNQWLQEKRRLYLCMYKNLVPTKVMAPLLPLITAQAEIVDNIFKL